MPLYWGDLAGARIIAAGGAIATVDTDFALDVTTWDIVPAGEVGDVLFRSVDVSLKVDNGYDIGITPRVDGDDQAEQFFSGAGTGYVQCQAKVAVRGARLAARVRTLSRAGAVEIQNIAASGVVVRRVP